MRKKISVDEETLIYLAFFQLLRQGSVQQEKKIPHFQTVFICRRRFARDSTVQRKSLEHNNAYMVTEQCSAKVILLAGHFMNHMQSNGAFNLDIYICVEASSVSQKSCLLSWSVRAEQQTWFVSRRVV